MKRSAAWAGWVLFLLGIYVLLTTIEAMSHGMNPVGGSMVWVLLLGGNVLLTVLGLAIVRSARKTS